MASGPPRQHHGEKAKRTVGGQMETMPWCFGTTRAKHVHWCREKQHAVKMQLEIVAAGGIKGKHCAEGLSYDGIKMDFAY